MYGIVIGFFVLLAFSVLMFRIFYHTPTCFDGIKNSTESGIDCGGLCAKVCYGIARKPVVNWAQSFRTSSNTVTAVAYIKNTNAGELTGSYGAHYFFRLYDKNNLLIVERSGIIDIPPQNTVPVIEPNVVVGNREVAHTFFDFSVDPTWIKIAEDAQPSLHVKIQSLSSDGTRLSATVVNSGLYDVRNLTLVATLFDVDGEAIAASKSLVPIISANGSQSVVFTWSQSSKPVRAEIIPLPALPAQTTGV